MTYQLLINGGEVKCSEEVLLVVHGRIAQLLSEETEEIWLAHVIPGALLSDANYLRCERHGVVVYLGEVPDLGDGLLDLVVKKHRAGFDKGRQAP